MQGAAVALLGVLITLTINVAVTAIQLWNANKDRQLEREHNLKKDVYLEFSADLRESLRAFSHLSDPGFPFEKVAEVAQRATRSASKVELIAPSGTIGALAEINTLMAHAFMRLAPDALALRNRQVDVQCSIDSIQRIQAEQAQHAQMLKGFDFSGDPDGGKKKLLLQLYERAKSEFEEERKIRDIAINEMRELQLELSLKVNKFIEEFDPHLDELIARIRVDIRIDKDKGKAFRAAAKVDHAMLRETFIEQDARMKSISDDDMKNP